MSEPIRKKTLLLNDLQKIHDAFSDARKTHQPTKQKTKMMKDLSSKLNVSDRTLRAFWKNPEELEQRIKKIRKNNEQMRTLLEFERLLCWPMTAFLKIMKNALENLPTLDDPKFRRRSRLASDGTCKNKIYGLYSYELSLVLREFRGNSEVKERVENSLMNWENGDVAVHCTQICWEKEEIHKEGENSPETITVKKKENTLLLVADRHNPAGRIVFSIHPKDLNAREATTALQKLIDVAQFELKTLRMTANYENGKSVSTFPGYALMSELCDTVVMDPPTFMDGPIEFVTPADSEEVIKKRIAKIIDKIGSKT